MGAGDVGRVNFDGSLGFDLAVSYGLASYKFSAPGVDSVQTSMQRGVEKLTIPTVDVEAGAKASFSYTHSDHFGAIIQKVDPQNATMYLVRSAASEVGASVGVTVGISVTPKTASVDKNALGGSGQRRHWLRRRQSSGVGRPARRRALSAEPPRGSQDRTGMRACWLNFPGRQNARFCTPSKSIFLIRPRRSRAGPILQKETWPRPVQIGGLTLLPGSGVSSELKRSVSIGLHFFNFFSVTDASVYFQNSYTEIGPDGSIRYLYDVGKESDEQTKKTLVTSRIHFVASLTQADKNNIKNVAVDLCMELSESNKVNDGNAIAAVISSLPPSAPLNTAETAMRNFVVQSPKGTLTLATVLKGSAYGRLTCSQFTGAKHDIPPAPPQTQDQANWYAYRDAARSLQGLNYVSSLTYEDWEVFNQYSNYGKPSGAPNRRADGSPDAVPPSFYSDRNIGSNAGFVSYFLRSSSHFMNLCDDLVALAGTVGTIDTITGWNRLLKDLTILAKSLMSDWTRPSACALFGQCGVGATVQSNIQPGGKAKAPSLTCTVTVN